MRDHHKFKATLKRLLLNESLKRFLLLSSKCNRLSLSSKCNLSPITYYLSPITSQSYTLLYG
jgi:hypothetical protein